jgi:hypothetical protein
MKTHTSKTPHRKSHTLSQSYSAILPTSLASVMSKTRGFEPKTPAAVIGTTTLEAHSFREFFKVHVERTVQTKSTFDFYKKRVGLRIILIKPLF